MTNISTLKNLLLKLKREEIKSLLKYLRYYQDSVEDGRQKSFQLVQMLLAGNDYTAKEIQHTLYKKESYHAFSKLLSRTKDKIYEVLLFDNNLSKPVYSIRNKVIFETRKKLLQSEILYNRGMTDELDAFQNKIISKAKSYEIYDTLLEALHQKQRFLGFRIGTKAHEKIKEEIKFFEVSRDASLNARSVFNGLAAKINFSMNPLDYNDELKKSIEKLKKDFEKTKSASVGYYLYFLQTEFYQNNKKYKNAEVILAKLSNLINENISIYTNARMGEVLVNISNNDLYLMNFIGTINNSILAQKNYESKSINFSVALEVEFYARYYSGEILESEKIIQELYNTSRTSTTPFLHGKHGYLFACIKTLKGDIAGSNELLHDVKEIDRDKEGFNIAKRVLTIINRIEAEDFDSADLKVNNLEKHIRRILKIKHVRQRDITILRILFKLMHDSFNFKKVYTVRKRYFDLLASSDIDYRWQIKSPELIVFHEWFRCKMENRKYDVAEVMEKMKRNLRID